MIQKDTYIVRISGDSSNFPKNYCFKARETFNYLRPYLDAGSSKSNGNSNITFKNETCRLATQAEIREYDRLGKPFDVTSLINKNSNFKIYI